MHTHVITSSWRVQYGALLGNLMACCEYTLYIPGERFKNTYELFQELFKCQCCIKIASFNVWVRYSVWNFKGPLWNSTQNILPMHWKMCILFTGEILKSFRFSLFETPPWIHIHYRVTRFDVCVGPQLHSKAKPNRIKKISRPRYRSPFCDIDNNAEAIEYGICANMDWHGNTSILGKNIGKAFGILAFLQDQCSIFAFHHNTVEYSTLVCTALQWPWWNIEQILKSHMTHLNGRNMSTVCIMEEVDTGIIPRTVRWNIVCDSKLRFIELVRNC